MTHRLAAAALALVLSACGGAVATPSRSSVVTTEPRPATPTPTASEPRSNPPAAALALAKVQTTGPAAREDHTWTVDPGSDVAYLFGGRDGTTIFDDLWAYDLAADAWSKIDAPTGPAARFGHEATWVDGVGLVVFAGQTAFGFENDLWVFSADTSTWRELSGGDEEPVARYGTCSAIGPDGRLWISHGFTTDGSRFSDTWAYDFAAERWTEMTPADGPRPVERCLHACWWGNDGFVLYAGQTTGVTALGDRWLFSDHGWTEVDAALPPARNLYADARLASGTIVLGGQAVDGAYLDDLWLLPDDGAAVELSVDVTPSGRAGAEIVRDDERVLLFGGRDAEGALDDVWQLSGGLLAGG